jgi:hypothetical protein
MADKKNIFLYTKDGSPILNYKDIPEKDMVLFVGYQISFSGIERIFCSE